MAADSPHIAYVMKRYPRLSETFIVNEIAAMERLGVKLSLFSLLQPEPPPHHPVVEEIKSRLYHLPAAAVWKIIALVRAHGACAFGAPHQYAHALWRAFVSLLQSGQPLAVSKQFMRAGFVADFCRRERVTSIHAHFANTPAAVAWLASAMSGIPFSFTTHAKDLYLTAPAVMRKRAQAASFIATCTRYNVDHLTSILPECDHKKVRLVYHGIDLDRFAPRQSAETSKTRGRAPLILSVGRLVPKKGLDDLVAACQILHDQGIRFRCAIVGEGPLRPSLESDIARRGLLGLVSLMGAMTHSDLIAFYGEADIFALPPRIIANGDRDGIPNVIVEAMAIGVPVVTTSVSGIPELVENDVTGLLVPSESPQALATALRQLLGSPQTGLRLARNARLRIEQNFDCHQTTRALRDLMESCACVPESVEEAGFAARQSPSAAEAAE